MNEENNDQIELNHPIDPFIEKISIFTDKIFKDWVNKGIVFEIEGEIIDSPIHTVMLSSPSILLPIIMVDADKYHREMMLDKKLPFYFYNDNGIFDICPGIYNQSENNSMALWTHHIDHSIEKAIEKAEPAYKKKLGKQKIMVSLDYMHQQFEDAMKNDDIVLKSSPIVRKAPENRRKSM